MSFSGGGIEILTNISDLAKHSIITSIYGKEITKKTVYQFNHPKLTTSKKLIPIAFLQALKVENINLGLLNILSNSFFTIFSIFFIIHFLLLLHIDQRRFVLNHVMVKYLKYFQQYHIILNYHL